MKADIFQERTEDDVSPERNQKSSWFLSDPKGKGKNAVPLCLPLLRCDSQLPVAAVFPPDGVTSHYFSHRRKRLHKLQTVVSLEAVDELITVKKKKMRFSFHPHLFYLLPLPPHPMLPPEHGQGAELQFIN